MSRHSLPDDIDGWPDDPYRLLGVDPGSDKRSIRRAYVRLIRRFKPDAFPEHFQRIHAAYEFISRFAPTALPESTTDGSESFDSGFSDSEPEEVRASPLDGRESEERPERDVHEVRETATNRFGRSFSPERDSAEEERIAWKAAVEGDPAEAYAKLLALQADETASDTACIRLYWLLTAMPQLDESRRPCDWLVEALRRTGFRGPAVALYSREVHRDPSEAIEPRCDDLLASTREAGALCQLLGLRWRAFSILEYPGRVAGDLRCLRESVTQQELDLWVFSLVLALDQVAWFHEYDTVRHVSDSICRELEKICQTYGRFYDELSHVDRLIEIANGVAALKSIPEISNYWPELIHFAWTRCDEDVRREVHRAAGRIAGDPFEALKTMSQIGGVSPAAMHYLGSLLLGAAGDVSQNAALDGEDIKMLFYRFLHVRRSTRLSADDLLLEFCLREDVAPAQLDQLGDFVAGLLRDRVPAFANLPMDAVPVYRDDGPLHYVYAACRLSQEVFRPSEGIFE